MTAATATRRTQQERRNESDARIIDAAIELFARQGYRQTTLIQIGDVAGYTGTLISNRFGSKENLLRAVLTHILDRFQHRPISDEMPKGGDRAALAAGADWPLLNYIDRYLNDVVDKQSRIRALHVIIGESLVGLPQVHDQIIKVNQAFRKKIEDYLVFGIQGGAFRSDLDIFETSVIIVGLLRGVTMQALAEPDRLEIRAMIAPLQAAVMAIVCRDRPGAG